jgi:hypothetical protein
MPIAIVPMTDEFKWSLHWQGWILSAFAFGYLTSQVNHKKVRSNLKLIPQKLALTSPTNSGRSVGIVRSRNKATKLVSLLCTAFSHSSSHILIDYSFLLKLLSRIALD